ncbi:homoserine kinase [Thermoflexibacter ruber]|uniref:Homoserine kinase n=1 Tax=Thermoflexibacter ruber TaxID=1003 RepID=A0A1I2F953_9BACT|nr:homoserine kinase [Thermoflexibacter ruber]SFF01715.1 homoserine kinase [Thermoflexibacter ruber]
MNKQIKVFAPATVANVACGFDVLGFALNEPGDEVILQTTDSNEVTLSKITGDGGKLPLDVSKNTAAAVIKHYLAHIGSRQGIDIQLHKRMPLGSGLGSSAASAVAGLFAVNELLGSPLTRAELLPFAMEGERIASGAAHADNVAPALLGGFVLVRSYNPLDIVSIPFPKDLVATVVHPQIEIRTEDARSILKKSILLKDAIQQWGNIGGLIAGLIQGDYDLIKRSLQDVIIEPVRSLLIPNFDKVKQAALESGALGCSISGSGPSIFALSNSLAIAGEIASAMRKELKVIGIDCDVYISPINNVGARVLGVQQEKGENLVFTHSSYAND